MIRNLSYIGFASPAYEEWRTFGPEVLGAELAAGGDDGTVRLRVDDAAWRVAIHPGEADELAYLGWDVAPADFDVMITRVQAAGFSVQRGDASLAGDRAVAELAWFVGPFGLRHELSHGCQSGAPFAPGRAMSGFVTGEQGLGHAVLIVPELAAAEEFFIEVLGFKDSDTIHAMGTHLRFFHCAGTAARHHTLAVVPIPGMVGMHHLMLEVNALDDVGHALDLINEREIPLMMTLGRHPNDRMLSFYVRTPSGFDLEYGYGGRLIDDRTWQLAEFDAISEWGHKSPAVPLLPAVLRPFQPATSSEATGAST